MKPIEHSSDVNGTEEGVGQLHIVCADRAECFVALGVVLDAMSLAVETAVKGKHITTTGFGWDANVNPKRGELSCEGASVEPLVSDEPSTSQRWDRWLDRELIVTLSRAQHADDQTTAQIDSGGQFTAQPTFGFTYSLGGLATTRARSMLMHFA